MQDVFANQLAAEIGQHQQAETGQRPADCLVPAPAEAVTAPQQYAEDDPGQARQQGFVHQVLGEQVLDEQPAGDQRQREQGPAGPEKAEQQAFHGLQRRKVLDQPQGMLVLELVVLQQHQQRLEHRDGEHAVGQDRQQDVGEHARFLIDHLHCTGRGELRQQHREQPQREQQDQQVFHRDARAGDQCQSDHGGSDQAGRAEEIQGQAVRRHQVSEQTRGVRQQGEDAKTCQQAFVGLGALGQAGALVEGRSGI